PTRLLDLQAFGNNCLDIRLIEIPIRDSPFATLSHCWGASGNTKCQATMRALRDLRDRILYTDLPKTYRDAITVCRSLEIRYLWIDSLCIIQDSKEDWAREATSMSYVYSNSHLTISADWSPNPEGGCFKAIDAPPGFEMEETVCITTGRAWAFQERFLSRRNLHFTQNQLFWECREGFAGEDKDRLHAWCHKFVEKYSRARITFPTDRIPAISALARLFADDLCSPYLAGLWLEGLWYTLSWFRPDHEGGERPKDYIAPSWSWCS
ncbi:heterokaryon incompatibility protein-domain-containing protein, partial [Bisporella sp. PMI_857]